MFFTNLFLFLSILCLVLGVNNYGFNVLKLFFQNVNWDYYSPTPLKNLAWYFSFVFGFLSFHFYKLERLKKKSILKIVFNIYRQIKASFLKRIKNLSSFLSVHTLIFTLLVLFGLYARAYKMPFTILYDEAATYLDYCDGGFTSFLKIFNTNNHLINTILMKVSITTFGNDVFALRLPSFLFGFTNLLLIYYISKKLYGKLTALISTFLYSSFPLLIHFESLARGYSFKVTFTLLLFIACFNFLKKPSGVYLFIISFISSLGFLTIFSFLFPFLGFLLWIAYELYFKKGFEIKLVVNYTFLIILYTKFISVFFYAPSIIFSNGIYNILRASRSGNINVYGSFPEDIPNFLIELYDKIFFNNSLLAILVFCLTGYAILKRNKLTSLVLSQFLCVAIIIVALKAIFPSRIFIYLVPFIILLISEMFSKIFSSVKEIYFLILPILQLLLYIYFFENKVINHYHSFVNDGVEEVIEELNRLSWSNPDSKILLKAHSGYYKSFKYYQRVNDLPIIEMYDENKNNEAINVNKQETYIISSKNNIIKNKKNLPKIFEVKNFEIYKSNFLQ